MNEEDRSIWRKSWRGPRAFLVWMLVLVGLGVVVARCLSAATRSHPNWLLLAGLSIIAVLGLLFVFWFLRWLCCWRNLRRFLVGGAIVVTFIGFFYTEENWRGKRAWEHFRQQSEARGEKLTIADLAPPPVAEDDNFAMAPIFVRTINYMWKPPEEGPQVNTGLKLDLWRSDDGPKTPTSGGWQKSWQRGERTDLRAWQDYYRAPVRFSGGRQLSPHTNEFPVAPQPQSPAADVLLALSKFDSAIEEIREAGRRPCSRFPINYAAGAGLLLPHLANWKNCSQTIQMRAVAELNLDQREKALDDVRLLFRLAEALQREPLKLSHYVRIAVLEINLQTIWEGLVDHKWDDAQLAVFERELAKLDFLADYHTSMRGLRAGWIEVADFCRNNRDPGWLAGEIPSGNRSGERSFHEWAARIVPGGWFELGKISVCEAFADCIHSVANPEAHTLSPSAANHFLAACERPAGTLPPGNLLLRTLPHEVVDAAWRLARGQAYADLARVACALERYRLTCGSFPENLRALVPQFLDKLPPDVIGGQPLRYRRTSNGQFVLYSVGWNEKDDGGESSTDREKGDWVWRYPAK